MLIIPIKEGENIDRALKRFKRKFDRTGTMRQLRSRQAFIKPSVKQRAQLQKAQYAEQMNLRRTLIPYLIIPTFFKSHHKIHNTRQTFVKNVQ